MKVEECVTTVAAMPSNPDRRLWDAIVVDQQVKDRLLHQALLNLRIRPVLRFEVSALHGLVVSAAEDERPNGGAVSQRCGRLAGRPAGG